jgi:type IV secretory pathway VirB2 component (pilin)
MIKKLLSFSVLALFGLVLLAMPALAQTTDPLGLNFGAQTGLSDTDIRVTIGNIIQTLLGLLGLIAVILILYAGFTWMTSGGNDEKIGQAKKTLISAVIGLAIILSAYAITSFVVGSLYEATTGVQYGTP